MKNIYDDPRKIEVAEIAAMAVLTAFHCPAKVSFKKTITSSGGLGAKNPYIHFSLSQLDHIHYYGFHEYSRWQHILPDPLPVGDKAIMWLACHEAAHAINAYYNNDLCHSKRWGYIYEQCRNMLNL